MATPGSKKNAIKINVCRTYFIYFVHRYKQSPRLSLKNILVYQGAFSVSTEFWKVFEVVLKPRNPCFIRSKYTRLRLKFSKPNKTLLLVFEKYKGNYRKITIISPGFMFVQNDFLLAFRGILFSEELITGRNFAFQNELGLTIKMA